VLGQCEYTFAAPTFPAEVTIAACADAYGDGSCEPDSPVATATKTYVLPSSTTGAATGGGRVGSATIGFTAKSDGNTLTGSCAVTAGTVTVKCVDVIAYAQVGDSATFYGHATVNGIPTLYRIHVVDASESGVGRDLFDLTTAGGYTVAGTLTEGNLQVR
jgi:hypothetical protein